MTKKQSAKSSAPHATPTPTPKLKKLGKRELSQARGGVIVYDPNDHHGGW